MDIIILLIIILLTIMSEVFVKVNYNIYRKREVKSNYTGKDVCEKILSSNGINDVEIGKQEGVMTDYYDSRSDVIMLSSEVYEDSSISSVSIAAHECGHVLQYYNNYFPIKLRNMIVPFINFSSKLGYIIIIISLFTSISKLYIVGLILISLVIIFQLITLPIEYDASRRGKKMLMELGIIDKDEKRGVRKVLSSAAFTYLASFLSSLLELIWRIILIKNEND